MKFDTLDRFTIAAAVLLLGIVIGLAFTRGSDRYQRECEAAGGVYFEAARRHEYLCLSKSAVIHPNTGESHGKETHENP